jgi:hypothetical protein
MILIVFILFFDLMVNVYLTADAHAPRHAACRCLVSVGCAFMVRLQELLEALLADSDR